MPPPPKPNAWSSGTGWIGKKQQQAAVAAAATAAARNSTPNRQRQGGPVDMAVEAYPPLPPKPNLLVAAEQSADALASSFYQSPRTDPQPRAQPPITRAASADGRAKPSPSMEDRLAALQPRGRVQRKQPLSAEEVHKLRMDAQRHRRADEKVLQQAFNTFMADLSRYDLPLVQLPTQSTHTGRGNGS